MTYIKKYKIFESEVHPIHYLKDKLFSEITSTQYSYLYEKIYGKELNINTTEKLRIERISKHLMDSHSLKKTYEELYSDFPNDKSKSIYSFNYLDTNNSNEFIFTISKLEDDYWLIYFDEIIPLAEDDYGDGDPMDTAFYFLCDGIDGLIKCVSEKL